MEVFTDGKHHSHLDDLHLHTTSLIRSPETTGDVDQSSDMQTLVRHVHAETRRHVKECKLRRGR